MLAHSGLLLLGNLFHAVDSVIFNDHICISETLWQRAQRVLFLDAYRVLLGRAGGASMDAQETSCTEKGLELAFPRSEHNVFFLRFILYQMFTVFMKNTLKWVLDSCKYIRTQKEEKEAISILPI